MRLLKIAFVTGVGVVAVAFAMAASALASGPTLLFPASNGPTVLISTPPEPNTIPTKLESTAGKLVGSGVLSEFTLLQLTSPEPNVSGIYTSLFLNVKEELAPEAKCHSEGDPTGEVLVPGGTLLLVYDALGTGSALGVAARLSVPEFKVICGTNKLKIKGSVLSLITPINTVVAANSNTAQGSLRCSATADLAEETRYWNQKGTEEHVELSESNGAGFEKACELIGSTSTSTITLLPNKEIEIDG
jgi:hypothetical protein